MRFYIRPLVALLTVEWSLHSSTVELRSDINRFCTDG